MALIDNDDVKAIMESYPVDATIDIYIDIAETLIGSLLSDAGHGADVTLEIQRWLTAHLIAYTIERMGETEKVGEASIKYIGKFGLGLEATPYGKTAMMFDTSGILGNLGKKTITIRAIKQFED